MDDSAKFTPIDQFDFEAAVRAYREQVHAAIKTVLADHVLDEDAREGVVERLMPHIDRFAGAYADAVSRRRLTENRAKRSNT